jgi:hypothetical protein
MRLVLYILLLAQTAALVYVTSIMVDTPFNTSNMRTSYYNGCNLGRFYITSLKFTCKGSADSYKRELDRLISDD